MSSLKRIIKIANEKKNKKFQKKGSNNSLNKLSLFQKSDAKFSKKCPLSRKKCSYSRL